MKSALLVILPLVVLAAAPRGAIGDWTFAELAPLQLVQADDADIAVTGYSVPSFVDWNNDGLSDLVVGEGGSVLPGKVRVYLNTGTDSSPQFSQYFYAQSGSSDLTCDPSGCMGCFPRVLYWDADQKKDLLVGESAGTLRLFLNVGSDEAPTFDAGTLLQVGQPGAKANIDVGSRATPAVVDWNNDGRKDLAVGAYDGLIHLFINEGTDTEPDFRVQTLAQANGSDLDVGSRSSPDVLDLNFDGRKDLLAGNTAGELLFYPNVATDPAPAFSDYTLVTSAAAPVDLPGDARSRPFICYWTPDAYPDVLVGGGDGKIYLYQGVPLSGDLNADGWVDSADFAFFADEWLKSACGQCNGADLYDDDNVDFKDLAELADKWLTGL